MYYAIAKAGLDQLTRAQALELIPHGVRVNCVKLVTYICHIFKLLWFLKHEFWSSSYGYFWKIKLDYIFPFSNNTDKFSPGMVETGFITATGLPDEASKKV